MSRTLVTGGTGLLGYNVVTALLARQRSVRVMVRSVDRARAVMPAECELVQGDVTDSASIRRAMEGCSVVYHAAGLPEQWLPDPGLFERVNVKGTRHMVDAALELGVERFLYTSTIDVFDAASGAEYDESVIATTPKGTAYERSKQDADRIVTEAVGRGFPAVFLHPSGLYGPGPETSPGLNNFFVDLAHGKIPLMLPGGLPVVYSEDVAAGHLLAEEAGTIGGRYILSERYMDLDAIAREACEALGGKKVPAMMPLWVARAVSSVGEFISGLTGKPPLIPKGQLYVLMWQARPSCRRACEELGWDPVPFDEGVRRAIAYLKEAGRL